MEPTEGRRSVVDSRQNWLVVQLRDKNVDWKLVMKLNHDSRINASTVGNMFCCSCKILDFNEAVKLSTRRFHIGSKIVDNIESSSSIITYHKIVDKKRSNTVERCKCRSSTVTMGATLVEGATVEIGAILVEGAHWRLVNGALVEAQL